MVDKAALQVHHGPSSFYFLTLPFVIVVLSSWLQEGCCISRYHTIVRFGPLMLNDNKTGLKHT